MLSVRRLSVPVSAVLFALVIAGSADAQRKKSVGAISGTLTKTKRVDKRFAVIGDYGEAGADLQVIADLIEVFDAYYIVTLGDNNYPDGEAATIDQNIGQYFHEYIGNYSGVYGLGAAGNDFYPSIGNRDYTVANVLDPYLDYFTLPGNERYYDFRRGAVHFYLINSDDMEPDGGIDVNGIQAQWLEDRLASTTAPYKVVVLHHRPFVSASTGSRPLRQWPFAEWGADVVLTGHAHVYERVDVEGVPYFVNGIGGAFLGLSLREPVAGSQMRFADEFGAQLVDVDLRRMRLRLVTIDDVVMDEYLVFNNDLSQLADELVPRGATWTYLDDGTYPGATWNTVGFDDSSWSSGPEPLGYEADGTGTTIGFGSDPANPYVTTYLRHELTVLDAGALSDLTLDLRADDGAIVYLNGSEIHRINMPVGSVDLHTLALGPVERWTEDDMYATEHDPALLVTGSNVLAIELHGATVAGLRGEYFNEITLPALGTLGDDRRTDATIDFFWSGDAPDGTTITPDDEYAERWVGSVFIEASGSWTFTTTSNDGVELFVDGVNLISNWTQHATTVDSASQSFSAAGWYPLRLEHFNDGGTATIKLEFEGPSHAKEVIPTTHLRTDYDDDSADLGETDVVMGARLSGFRSAETLVPKGSDWNYLTGVTPDSSWIEPSYDDSSWTLGTAELGYGEGDEATVIPAGPPSNRYITAYFRHEFEVVDASAWNSLILRLLRDDGAAVYLNGTEVRRVNLPQGDFDGSTQAKYEIVDDDETVFYQTRIDHQFLVDGTNYLAVEIHQESKSDVDFSFDLELIGRP